MTKCITVAGVLFTVTDDFDTTDPEALEALTALAKHMRSKAAEVVTPEMAERQEASCERIRARNAALRSTEGTNDDRR